MINLFLVILYFHFPILLAKEATCGCELSRSDSLGSQTLKLIHHASTDKCFSTSSAPNQLYEDMVMIPEGSYLIGTNNIQIENDFEGPARNVTLSKFLIDKHEVSVENFAIFVNETGYITEAEVFGDSFIFGGLLNNSFKDINHDNRAVVAPWWYKIKSVDWRHPEGPDSSNIGKEDHPVVHVSWNDAVAYCSWRKSRLPTEAEFEAACRGGYNVHEYPWGDKLFPNQQYMANIWQGTFPTHNSAKDGYVSTSPVNAFPQNDFGLHSIVGNVWEWTNNSWSDDKPQEKVKKGGSYMCHKSYCFRYRCAARSHNTADSSAGNLGFRCARNVALS